MEIIIQPTPQGATEVAAKIIARLPERSLAHHADHELLDLGGVAEFEEGGVFSVSPAGLAEIRVTGASMTLKLRHLAIGGPTRSSVT